MVDPQRIDAELARRYRWFCEIGWKECTLNHPSVIHGKATPAEIDQLIIRGMKKWPSKSPSNYPPHFHPPKEAA